MPQLTVWCPHNLVGGKESYISCVVIDDGSTIMSAGSFSERVDLGVIFKTKIVQRAKPSEDSKYLGF